MGWEFLVYALVMLVASYLITSLTATKPQGAKPAALAEFEFPSFEEGTPQCVVFGDVWITDPMVLWYGDLQVDEFEVSSGGKK